MRVDKMMPIKPNKPGCTRTYTSQKVKDDVVYLYEQKHSLRGVADHYGKPITYGDIQRILNGKEPRKRKVLRAKQVRPLISSSVAELLWMLANREAVK